MTSPDNGPSMLKPTVEKRGKIWVLFTAIGAIAGYAVFHPYTMLIYMVIHPQEGGQLIANHKWNELLGLGISVFQPIMLPMALSFASMGAIVGLLLGIVLEKKKRLLLAQHENEKKKIAIETLQSLMITLSHYLLNANVIIGGRVRHCRKIESNEDIRHSLEVIEQEAKKIDTVIGILQNITKVSTAHYAAGQNLLDISKEIEERMSG